MHSAVFAPIGDEGRASLVEGRIDRAISAGALADGERLPSESELARSFGVAVVTVREALDALRKRGLIETRRGRSGGSFVTASRSDAVANNEGSLLAMPRVELNDLAVHYETIAAACAEFACVRATPDELEVIQEILAEARGAGREAWRRIITDVQLELAGLSQSVRLTREHVRLQAEFTPLLTLQDGDAEARERSHDALTEQVQATLDRDFPRARAAIRESVSGSLRWLVRRRATLSAGLLGGERVTLDHSLSAQEGP
ncbi:GntR family transcriptional regulator [Leucobacter sp. M11]|nr:GntR family transcriptional regulator [Leucobacter sp. M11]